MSYYGYDPYVSVAEKRQKAEKEVNKLRKKGLVVKPVVMTGTKLAETFWGKAWCKHLASYADYENRLARGRSYVRSGAVCHLEIEAGCVHALVSGTQLYEVSIDIKPLPLKQWDAIKTGCQGQIGDMLDILRGKLPKTVISRMCDTQTGLFPAVKDIKFSCSCPDWASMCKHVAATLYAVGRRLDTEPELLFLLRQVDAVELLSTEGLIAATVSPAMALDGDSLQVDDLGALFGIELESREADSGGQSSSGGSVPQSPTISPKAKRGRKAKTESVSVAPTSSTDSTAKLEAISWENPTGADITLLREQSGMSLYAFAAALDVAEGTVQRWENTNAMLRLQVASRQKLKKMQAKLMRKRKKMG